MSVSNFLVHPYRKLSIKHMAINEITKKALTLFFFLFFLKKFKLTFKFRSHFNL